MAIATATAPKILLVEDDVRDVTAIQEQLQSQGYVFSVAATGMHALEMAGTVLPDLIILDVLLPDIDGFEVCRRLRRQPVSAHIPILFYTNAHSIDEKLIGLQLGASDFLSKSAVPRELLVRVRNLLSLKKSLEAWLQLTVVDGLTRLYNREYWLQRLEEECCRSRRFGRYFCGALIEVDGLMLIQQQYGDDAQDRVLCQIAQLLERGREEGDVVCRFAQDGFAWLLIEQTIEQAQAQLERFRRAVETMRCVAATRNFSVTVSCGVTACGSGCDAETRFLPALETALQQARVRGRNQVCVVAAPEGSL